MLSDYRGAASLAETVHHLLVCKHGIALRTPVHRSGCPVGESVLVELQEAPLSPFVVIGHAGLDFIIPVKGSSHLLKLSFHSGYVGYRGVIGMDACLYGVVLGRESECVESHRMEYVVALHALVSRIGVSQAEIIPVSDVELCSGRVREHLKHVFLWLVTVPVEAVEPGVFPLLLPFLFDLRQIHICHLK